MPVSVGEKAPNFTLPDITKKMVSLSDFAGKKIVLLFYPGAFTGVCEKEMCTIRDSMADFNKFDAQVIGISVDSPFANKGFSEKNGIAFPLLSDYTKKVAEQYCGLFHNFAGLTGLTVSNRAVFIIDANGTVTYRWIAESPGTEPPYDEVKKAAA